jgi:large subunit ribosomal protein L18
VTASLLKRRNGRGVGAQRAVGRARRHFRLRRNLSGTAERPRVVVTRSLRNITVQIVDDTKGHTLVSASSLDASIRSAEGDKRAIAEKVGTLLAERAKAAGIERAVFDRGGYQYHGRVQAFAEGVREGGLAV